MRAASDGASGHLALHNTWEVTGEERRDQEPAVMTASALANFQTSRTLVWLLFWTGVVAFLLVGFLIAVQAIGHFESDSTRTLGQGELIVAAACLLFGPICCRVFRDLSLAVFAYHDQVQALRRDMNALASRAPDPARAAVARPPAPWQCSDCERENDMASLACAGCGKPFAT
jgi:hypothetical protein